MTGGPIELDVQRSGSPFQKAKCPEVQGSAARITARISNASSPTKGGQHPAPLNRLAGTAETLPHTTYHTTPTTPHQPHHTTLEAKAEGREHGAAHPGPIMSAIYGGLKNIGAALAVLQKLSSDYSALLARVNAAPGLPVTTPTQPYWEDDPPFPGLSDTRSAELPTHADVVVIGSGITAVAVVWALLHELQRAGREPKRVVVCEARRLCSGATGRNGGHIKASPHLAFAKFRKKLGPERAAALVRFQLLHLRTLVELCEAEGIDVAECREVETVDLFFGDEAYKASVRHAQELRKFVPEFDLHVWTAEEAREVSGLHENYTLNALRRPPLTWTRGTASTSKPKAPSPTRPVRCGRTASSRLYGRNWWTNSRRRCPLRPAPAWKGSRGCQKARKVHTKW